MTGLWEIGGADRPGLAEKARTRRRLPRLLGWSLIALGLGAAAPPPAGRPYYLQIEAPADGATQGLAGRRRATVCDVYRGPLPNAADPVFVRSGCRPSEGQSYTRWDDARQRMVPAAAPPVKPRFVSAAALLDLRAWAPAAAFADPPGRSAAGDYEVELMSRGRGPVRSRVVRRSGAWVRTFDVDWGGRPTLTVQNLDVGVSFQVRRDLHGRMMAIRGPFPIRPYRPPGGAVRIAREPDRQVLGETCAWWDLMPGAQDAGLWECRAADGAPLIVRHIQRGDFEDVFAIDVRRGRVPLRRVLPSKAEASARALGLEGP